MKKLFIGVITPHLLVTFGCNSNTTPQVVIEEDSMRESMQLQFWNNLAELEGKAFKGALMTGEDPDFTGDLIMHVRSVEESIIKVPFIVGADSSRTWIFTLENDGLKLNHDHRNPDGTEGDHNMYGGKTTNYGTAQRQVFPVDKATVALLPNRTTNVWWVDLVPGSHFTYNLRRVGSDRFFSVRFDLTEEVETSGTPWGW